jgi:hypothetical protein
LLMMVHGRTETKSPKNVKNVYEPTSATEHVLRYLGGGGAH